MLPRVEFARVRVRRSCRATSAVTQKAQSKGSGFGRVKMISTTASSCGVSEAADANARRMMCSVFRPSHGLS